MDSCDLSRARGGCVTFAQDWPLSREEKKGRLLHLFRREALLADQLFGDESDDDAEESVEKMKTPRERIIAGHSIESVMTPGQSRTDIEKMMTPGKRQSVSTMASSEENQDGDEVSFASKKPERWRRRSLPADAKLKLEESSSDSANATGTTDQSADDATPIQAQSINIPVVAIFAEQHQSQSINIPVSAIFAEERRLEEQRAARVSTDPSMRPEGRTKGRRGTRGHGKKIKEKGYVQTWKPVGKDVTCKTISEDANWNQAREQVPRKQPIEPRTFKDVVTQGYQNVTAHAKSSTEDESWWWEDEAWKMVAEPASRKAADQVKANTAVPSRYWEAGAAAPRLSVSRTEDLPRVSWRPSLRSTGFGGA